MNNRKLLRRLLNSPKNARFEDVCELVMAFGFHLERVSGSHYVFVHPDLSEIVYLQERRGEAKAYQVRQFLRLVETHHLTLEADE